MNLRITQKSVALSISILFFISLIIITKLFHGTGDEGDSVMHFLYAKYAFKYPYHFFHHWAKPLYVLLTCIPAQLGFKGIQLFNISINSISIFLVFKVAQKLSIKYAWLASLFLAIFPHQIIYSLSGLTEPLFAFTLILIIYLWLCDKKNLSLIILSFLPFIRSEGMVVIVVFFIFLLLKKHWRLIPFLIIGHVAYAVSGHFFYDKPLLWVFNENPYAVGASSYGSGYWYAFIVNMKFSTGIILYYVLWLGMLFGLSLSILKFILKKNVNFSLEYLFLIYGIFFSVFFFHSFAWYKGWFHSFGLIRVMVGVLPLVAIICAKAIDESFIFFPIKKNIVLKVTSLATLLVIINFSFKKYAVIPQRDLELRGDQQCQKEIGNYLWQNNKDCYNLPIYYSAPYISVVLNSDYFNAKIHPNFSDDFHNNTMQKPCYVLWDDWYAPVESGVSLEAILAKPEFKLIKKFWHWDVAASRDRVTILFKVE